jgi:hypothetical protein
LGSGENNGGASFKNITVVPGQILKIIGRSTRAAPDGGGGGALSVTDNSTELFIIAGGGGGTLMAP